MPHRRDNGPRVTGPHWSETRQRYFIKIYVPKGKEGELVPRFRWLGQDRQEAEDDVTDARKEIAARQGITFDKALTEYRTFLVETGHKKPNTEDSADETCRRLRLFFDEVLESQVSRLTEERAEELYRTFAARTYEVGPKKKRRRKPYSPAHHRHTLAQAKTFGEWCVKPKGWIKLSPLAEVKGTGEANVGKEQLTGDEARIFYKWCAFKAVRDDQAALALLMCLIMAMRQGAVRGRVVRDVDLDATVLRIGVGTSKKSKTKKGDVPQEIPAPLRPLIKKLADGRSPLEPLFKAADGGFRCESWLRAAAHRFCRDAGVPYVTPHGLKGTAGTLARTKAAALAEQVAAYLDHEQTSTSDRHYVAEGAAQAATAARALQVIIGGRQ